MSAPLPEDSVADASTNEEDYFFTSLGLEDDADDNSGSPAGTQEGDLLRPRNRDDRMKAAYDESKRLYRAQHAYTETGVSYTQAVPCLYGADLAKTSFVFSGISDWIVTHTSTRVKLFRASREMFI